MYMYVCTYGRTFVCTVRCIQNSVCVRMYVYFHWSILDNMVKVYVYMYSAPEQESKKFNFSV